MKPTSSFFLAALATALAPLVAAHGSVSALVANGKSYPGPLPGSTNKLDTAVRTIASLEPINDVNSAAMTCGTGAASSASEVAPVTAGSTVNFFWRSGNDGTPWPHTFGPIMTYMARCPNGAENCNGASLQWFKTEQVGLRADGSWFQAEINKGRPANTTIPSQLADGDYLIRHELIALHNAMSVGKAEFYVSCHQVRVTGGGGQSPPSNALVTFPGAYNAQDKGILVDIYTNFKGYTFPGPQLAFSGGSSGGGGAPATAGPGGAVNAGSSPTTQAPATTKTGSAAPATTTTTRAHKCNVQRHKRSVSRIMRRMPMAELAALSA